MKVGDLVKTKVSILNNRIAKDKLGFVIGLRPYSFSNSDTFIISVRFSDETRVWAYKEKDLELLSESG